MARRIFRFISLLAAFLLLLGAGLLAWAVSHFNAPGPGPESQVVFPHGAGLNAIAERLGRAGVIARPDVFVLGVRIMNKGRALKAGEYSFPARATPRQVLDILIKGQTVVRKLTLAEGLTTRQVLDLVAAAEGLEADLPRPPPEGALLPETYHYALGDSRAALIARMAAAMQRTLAELWPGRLPGLPLASPRQALILASIVEKESGLDEERRHIAGVFINRLRRGMRLQSDPTVVYALTAGRGPLARRLSRADLERPHPYNTYLVKGLPPGPIANPGRASLEAVLRPLATEDLYFVADGTGGHAFASTLDQHNRNVARWRKLRDKK